MQLDYRDVRPIYQQLQDRLRQQILSGILQKGDRLPSVRELAGNLAINPNTIQRAYRGLEAEGWVVSMPGKGTFVCDSAAPGTMRQRQLLDQLDSLLKELENAGMDRAAILNYLKGDGSHA